MDHQVLEGCRSGAMQLILHTGAHFTDRERLLKCLLNNKADFSRRGVAVPGPGRYRTLLKEAVVAMDEHPATAPDAREVLIDAILDEETAERAILSNQNFFGSPRFAVGGNRLYPLAARRMAQFHQLFPGDRIELFMGLCNPATLLPNVLARASRPAQAEILAGMDLDALRWSATLADVRRALPDMPITVWCNEDTPLIWAEIVRAMAGLEAGRKITGGFDLLREIMAPEGMRRFRAYLHRNKRLSDAQKRRVIAAFLDKYALEEALEEELDLPGWTEALVERLTEHYDADMQRVAALPGVRVIGT